MVWISTPPPRGPYTVAGPTVLGDLEGTDVEEARMMWSYGMSGFGWIVMVAWWVLVVAGIVWLVRAIAAQPNGRGSARRLLDERFAAGELSVEEYQERRRTLS